MTKILLVEDDKIIQGLIARYLMNAQYEIVFAEDGEQAVAQARAEMPDLILMDMRLPRLDGREATRRIKALPNFTTIPIIALTSQTHTADQQECFEAGCDAFEAKPIDFSSLLAQISMLLTKSTAAANSSRSSQG